MILAWQNLADAATISAGSQIGTLPASNLQNPHVVKKWHSAAGVKATHLLVDMGSQVSCSLLALLGSNLSSAATVRLRASQTDAEADAALQLDTGKIPAGAKSGYGNVYKRIRGSYLSLHGTERPALAFDFTAGHLADLIGRGVISVTRSGATATRVNERGLYEVVQADTPRLDHHPDTKAPRGILIETATTNICAFANNFEGSGWALNNATIVDRAVLSPDGTRNATRIAVTGGGFHLRYSSGTAKNGATWSGSLFIRQVSGAASLGSMDMNDGTPAPTSFELGVWKRCSVTGVPGAALTNIFLDVDLVPGEFDVWMANITQEPEPSSPIYSAGSTVTRNADDPRLTSLGTWYLATEGTIGVEIEPYGIDSGTGILSLNNGGTSERIDFRSNGSMVVTDGGVTQVNGIGANAFVVGAIGRGAVAFKANDFAVYVDGGAGSGDVSGTMPTPTQLQLGGLDGGTGNNLRGWLRRLTYYPKRLVNGDLQSGTRAEAPLVEVERNDIAARYWRIDIEDTTLPDNIQVGRLYLGPHWTPSVNMLLGWSVTPEDQSPIFESRGLQSYPDTLPKRRALDFTLDFMGEQEMYENAFAMARAAGVVKDILAIPNIDGAHLSEQAVYGLCQSHRPLEEPQLELYRQKFTIRERL